MRGPTPGFAGHLLTAVAGIAAGVAVFLYLFIGGGGTSGLADGYEVDALVPTVGALTPGARVTMAGAKVGHVASIKRHGVGTEVRLELTDDRVTPIPVDTRLTVRQRTPVGENYVSLQPGRSHRMLADGGVLPADRSDEYVDVDQILSVLRGSTRERARALIQSTGGALRGRGEGLNKIVGGGGQAVSSGARLLKVLSADREQVAGLVQRLGSVSSAVQESSSDVATIATKGLRSLQAVAARDDALARTLDVLPGTLAQVRSTSGKLGSVTDVATPVVANLATAVREVRPAVRTLRPAAQEGREALRALSDTAPRLGGTLERARSLAGPLTAALPALRETLCNVNPMVRYLKPYTPDVIASVVGLGSASNSYDAIGHLIRLTPIIGENSLVGLPDSVSKAAYTLLRAGFLSKSNGLTWNPYPEPGKVGSDGAGRGKSVFGPADVPSTGYKFPHVLADC
jgi:phospholipid/cholesterol/gamma-HCH transport system substrate-binding protein